MLKRGAAKTFGHSHAEMGSVGSPSEAVVFISVVPGLLHLVGLSLKRNNRLGE